MATTDEVVETKIKRRPARNNYSCEMIILDFAIVPINRTPQCTSSDCNTSTTPGYKKILCEMGLYVYPEVKIL